MALRITNEATFSGTSASRMMTTSIHRSLDYNVDVQLSCENLFASEISPQTLDTRQKYIIVECDNIAVLIVVTTVLDAVEDCVRYF